MKYKDRHEAGLALATALQKYKGEDAVVIAVPRGGIELAYPISKDLGLPLDIVLAKKLAHPIHREFAIGGVSLQESFYDANAGVSERYINKEIDKIRTLLKKRQSDYYANRSPEPIKGRIAIIVDDGIATGNTLMACVKLLHKAKPDKVVVAVPVGSPGGSKQFIDSELVDELVCLNYPESFLSVGQFYYNFGQVSDEQVIALLEKRYDERHQKLE